MRFDPKTAGLRPGERAHILCVAVDKDQAAQVFDFCAAMFANIPVLRALVRKIGRTTIELTNKVVINVVTNSYRSIRGRSLLAVVFDEVAYWRSDEISAVPDTEVHLAVKPGPGAHQRVNAGDDLIGAQAGRFAVRAL